MFSSSTNITLLLMVHFVALSSIVEAVIGTPRVENYVYDRLQLRGGVYGPETTAFDCKGEGPYVGVSDGRIMKWISSKGRWIEFAITSPNRNRSLCDGMQNPQLEKVCGRPLGLRFNSATCDLYIADAYFGLIVVGSKGGRARQLAVSAEGVRFQFANDLDIDPTNGVVYFTESSTRFERWELYKILDTVDRTGRLLKYDIHSRKVTVLLEGLAFANGVALSKKGDFVLVAETTTGKVHRYWLSGHIRSHTSDLFLQLGGMLDNIDRNANGDFWIAQYATLPPNDAFRTDHGLPVKVNEFGKILEILNITNSLSISDIQEFDDRLWLGSVLSSFVGVVPHDS